MPRARLLKPGFFKNEDLAALPFEARLCFEGLWTLADRKGRLLDKPKRIHAEIFPYDRGVDVNELLTQLQAAGFITRYTVEHEAYIAVLTFPTHQHPHINEPDSTIPAPPKRQKNGADQETAVAADLHQASTMPAPESHQSGTRAARGKNVLIRSRSLDPESESESKADAESGRKISNAADRVLTAAQSAAGFARFWAIYPNKKGKDEARKAWQKRHVTAGLVTCILAAVTQQITWPEWMKDGGQFIPRPAVWLARGSWDDEPRQAADGFMADLGKSNKRLARAVGKILAEPGT